MATNPALPSQVSVYMFGFIPDVRFCAGALLVLVATFVRPPPPSSPVAHPLARCPPSVATVVHCCC